VWVSLNARVDPLSVPTTEPPAAVHSSPKIWLDPLMRAPSWFSRHTIPNVVSPPLQVPARLWGAAEDEAGADEGSDEGPLTPPLSHAHCSMATARTVTPSSFVPIFRM
jgi:hypothetical protein